MLGHDVLEIGRKLPAQPRGGVEDALALLLRRWLDLDAGPVVDQLPQLPGEHRLLHRLVGVQQPECDPARVGDIREDVLDHRHEGGDRGLDFGRLASEPVRPRPSFTGRHRMGLREQLIDADPLAGRTRNDRHAELFLQLLRIERDPVSPGLVHEVQEDDDPVGDLEDLEDQVEVPLEARGVDDHDRHIRSTEEDEIARDLLVDAARLERVGAREVDDLHPLPFVRERPLRTDDGLPRPVSRMLTQTGELVEDRALAHVRIAGKRDEIVPAVRAQPQSNQASLTVLGACDARVRGERRHQATSSDVGVTGSGASSSADRSAAIRTHSACSLRSAMIAPRIR